MNEWMDGWRVCVASRENEHLAGGGEGEGRAGSAPPPSRGDGGMGGRKSFMRGPPAFHNIGLR